MSYPARTWAGISRGWAGRTTLACLVVFLGFSRTAGADATNQSPTTLTIDLADPAVMTGTFYEIGSNRQTVLFKYRRQATRDGNLIRVEQSFTLPDGSVACRENICYQNGQ